MPLPTAEDFCKKFARAFGECCKKAHARSFDEAWMNWTSFMTGKNSKIDSWDGPQVLPTVAKEFGLEFEREFMRIDLVLYEKGGCPLAVAIEHENDARGLETEMDKLFLIRSGLKVLITYAWKESKGFVASEKKLEDRIRRYYKDYASHLPPEYPETEYLFLLGNEETQKFIAWHYLSFKASQGPGHSHFEITQ